MFKIKPINYIRFSSLESTNTWTKQNAAMLDPECITCISAQEQTAGRGRFYRKWLSPRGQNIYATLFFRIPKSSVAQGNLGQLLSITLCSILKKHEFFAMIKWPNDLLIQNKKIAGILCETQTFDEEVGVILGFGLNVNMDKDLLEVIDQPATSLAQESGHPWDIEKILQEVIEQFRSDLAILEDKGFIYFHKQYEALLMSKDQLVSWTDGTKSITGIFHSISEDGRLNLIAPSGEIISLSSGELKTS
ncbi:MAG: biotin--[acetyl-CoA-carboxylase] ligase [Chlamydiae bacterium]|nr:biotin--[acetyl-CoA-carboxylase] ligase [Chlamydiota bacterium]